MIIVAGYIEVEAAGADEGEALARAMMAETRKEAGCVVYDITRSVERPTRYHVYEEWESLAALEARGALWRVVIDRPDKANALTAEMLGELARIAEDAHGQAQVLVLTGRGRVFSAGADLEAARAGLAKDPVWERLSGALAAS